MCLFAEANLPTETLLRIWDSFFLHGMDQVCESMRVGVVLSFIVVLFLLDNVF